jgi:hypothetical protein
MMYIYSRKALRLNGSLLLHQWSDRLRVISTIFSICGELYVPPEIIASLSASQVNKGY